MAENIFKDEFVPNIQTANKTSYSQWKNSNPGEATKWEAYRDAVLAYDHGETTPVPPVLATKYGKALVAAGKQHVSVIDLGAVWDPPDEPPPPPPPPPPTGTMISNFDMDTGVNPPNQWTGYAGYTNQDRFRITAAADGVTPRNTPGYFGRVECRYGEPAPWASNLCATIRQQAGLPIGYNKTYPDMYYGWSTWVPSNYPWSSGIMHSIMAEIHGAGSMQQAPFHWGILGNTGYFGGQAGSFFIDLHRNQTGYSPLFQPTFGLLSAPGMANRWIDNVVRIKWSQGSDGVLQYWMDGTLRYTYNGPTAPISGENIYPQLGLYCHNQVTSAQKVIYHDEARIGTTREIVDPVSYV